MSREEKELIEYLKNMQEGYIEGEGYDRYPLPEWFALNNAIKALQQHPCTLDDAREDFVFDVYNILDFLPTNDEANRIIEVFDRVTSDIRQEPILDKIKSKLIEEKECAYADFERYKVEYLGQSWEDVLDSLPQDDFRYGMERCIEIIDKHKVESEVKKNEEKMGQSDSR